MVRCLAITLAKDQCSREAKKDNNYCYQHIDYDKQKKGQKGLKVEISELDDIESPISSPLSSPEPELKKPSLLMQVKKLVWPEKINKMPPSLIVKQLTDRIAKSKIFDFKVLSKKTPTSVKNTKPETSKIETPKVAPKPKSVKNIEESKVKTPKSVKNTEQESKVKTPKPILKTPHPKVKNQKTPRPDINQLIELYQSIQAENKAKKHVPDFIIQNLSLYNLELDHIIHESNKSVIVKLKNIDQQEEKQSWVLKIMLQRGTCQTLPNDYITYVHNARCYIRMKYYHGPSLFFCYPYQWRDVADCCLEYFNIMKQQGIYHNQLIGKNCMRDNDGIWKLIDFNQSTTCKKNQDSIEKQYNHMQQSCEVLVDSLLNECDILWYLDTDLITKSQSLCGVMLGIHHFFLETFGNDAQMDFPQNIFTEKLMEKLKNCILFDQMCKQNNEFQEFITSLETLIEIRKVDFEKD
jgi:hypothetical protein